jgi:hypothetical protein
VARAGNPPAIRDGVLLSLRMTDKAPPAPTDFLTAEAAIRQGGGAKAIERQHAKGRLTARERIARLVDAPGHAGAAPPRAAETGFDPHRDEIPNFQELALWAAHGMYAEHGGAPAAGVVTGVGQVHGRPHMIIANDATVKAGAFFPMTCKKIIRAQHIARQAGCPWSIWSIPPASSCRSRRTSSPTPTTSGASFTSTPVSAPRASPRQPRSWATASPAAATCPSCATRS